MQWTSPEMIIMDDKSNVGGKTEIKSDIEIDISHTLESIFAPIEFSPNNCAEESDETEFSKKPPT